MGPGCGAWRNVTVEQPVAGIDQARQPAHRLSADSDAVVRLVGGTHWSSGPLVFGSRDGGRKRLSVYGGARSPGRQVHPWPCKTQPAPTGT
ncbi:hypothetical protein SAMN05216489_00506 [Streptomyces sp. 3213]|uniref:hypothetical protein n=1 Tax=Streptomyces sp. 3213.3 TaxID=1855348 RepID=UPI00089CBA00|nr:hypothetical protein [Streptomyces sp. 3213.3]SEC34910.1 hypothetical protein SAMN05216489_00506 [Streptomyces sp. 3213] [Streptomyces sp. 3213.3]